MQPEFKSIIIEEKGSLASVMLDIKSSDKGMLIPRLTTTQQTGTQFTR